MGLVERFDAGFPSTTVLVSIVVAVVLLIVVVLTVRWMMKRPKRDKAPSMDANRLRRIYRGFVRKQPADYRRSLLGFQPMVVLGSATSSKTEIINRFSDWEQQASDFLESSTEADELHLYLGSRVLVHEYSPTILADNSHATRKALLRLWRTVFRRRRPIVVIVVNARQLARDDPDEIAQFAHQLRGKVNLLSALRNEPVETRVVVTHVHDLVGFAEFSDVASRASLETRVVPDQNGAVLLESLQRHLPRALLDSTAPDYLKIVAFFGQLPKISKGLNRLLRPLFSRRALGEPPLLEGVYLVGGDEGTADPLWIRDKDLVHTEYDPSRKHALVAAALAAAAVIYLGSGYLIARALWVDAKEAVESYTTLENPKEKQYRKQIKRLLNRQSGPQRFFPSVFTQGALESLEADFSRKAVEGVIEPRLEKLVREHEQPLAMRAVYVEALVRATGTNELGRLVLKHKLEWSRATGLPEEFIADYVAITNETAQLPEELVERAAGGRGTLWDDTHRWERFFGAISELQDRCAPLLGDVVVVQTKAGGCRTKSAVIEKQAAEAAELVTVAQKLREFERATQIVANLPKSGSQHLLAALALNDALHLTKWAEEQTDLVAVLTAIAQASDTSKSAPATSLSTLADQLRDIRTQTRGTDTTFAIARPSAAAGDVSTTFSLNPLRWTNYAFENQVHWRVDAFLAGTKPASELLFADASGRELGSAVSPPSTSYLFPGRPQLDPRFTNRAFVEFVQPGVAEVAGELDELDDLASKVDRDAVFDHVGRAIAAYADEYDRALVGYFRDYAASGSANDLPTVLRIMASDSGYFESYLHIAFDNACMAVTDPVFAPLATTLAGYAGICKLQDVETPPTSGAVSPAEGEGNSPEDHASGGQRGGLDAAPVAKRPSPALTEYRAIITELAANVTNDLECSKTKDATGACGSSRASAQGGGQDGGAVGESTYQRLSAWADAIPLSATVRRPFLVPVQGAKRLSAQNVAFAVSDGFDRQLATELDTLYDLFPFDPSAKEEATPEEIEAVLHPKTGLVVAFIETELKSIVRVSNNKVRVLASAADIPLDTAILRRVNTALAVSELFYTDSGKPKPLLLEVRARPMRRTQGANPVPTLGFLAIDEKRVLSFYQRAVTRTVKLDWTTPHSAMVGLTLVDSTTDEQPVVGIPSQSVSPSCFAALRLLDEGASKAGIVSWDAGGYAVSFIVRKDPRADIRKAMRGVR